MSIQLDLMDLMQQAENPARPEPGAPSSLDQQASPRTRFAIDVSRAVHSALIMKPIYELEARRFFQGEADDGPGLEGGLDVMWIAFAILDAVSEFSEYQPGATRGEVIARILPLARDQAAAAGSAGPDDGLEEVLNKVFDHLVNRRNRYLPFRYAYFDGASGGYRERRFWLIKTVYTGEGKEALFNLTDEGYTAYFGLHEASALDATAIGNLRIKLLVERGNVDDAILVADGNRKQCARKALEVRNARRQIQRNIHAVDFARVRTLAEEGVNQATDIQKGSSRLHNLVMENLLASPGEKHGAKLHRLGELLERLNDQLMKLSAELQQLPEDYHGHSHKLFRRRSLGVFPAMDEVLGRVFALPEDRAAAVGAEFIARIDPPAQRPLFDPAAVIEACDRALERQNVPGDHPQSLLEVDGTPIERFVPDLDDTVMARAFEMLHTAVHRKGEIRLSVLLNNAAASGNGELFPVAVAMAVFQCLVERRLAEKHRLVLEMPDPGLLIGVDLTAGHRYRGHELFLKSRSSAIKSKGTP